MIHLRMIGLISIGDFAFVFGILALVDANAKAKFVLIIWVIATLVILGATTLVLEKKNGKK